ncbi:MAG TPA: DUF1579 domain-containing protein [Longimicrobium sp.]|nr:DUF1579 domain-containing protein [Longimicrobium sp.]
MQAEAQAEHHWLQRLAGEWSWTYEADMESGSGEPPVRETGTESVRSLGGVWVVCEGHSDDGTSNTIMTVGYDPEKKRFTGTYVGSMMTFLWVYDGELEPGDTRLALYSDGPSFTEPGKMARYRDTIEIISDDERVMTSHFQKADGEWHGFMTTRYRRTG